MIDPLYRTLEVTWPPAEVYRLGPWTIRDGAGGGKRVSAATAEGPVSDQDISNMEVEERALGQTPTVMIRQEETALDELLAARSYRIVDPVLLYAAPVRDLAVPPPPVSAFAHWPRLAIAEDIWADGGIEAARLAVMDRVAANKIAILSRTEDTPSGAAFVALHEKTAMIHAIHVLSQFRRKGAARNMMGAAACWAAEHEAETLALAVMKANEGARALYTSLGMRVVGHYHYRMK